MSIRKHEYEKSLEEIGRNVQRIQVLRAKARVVADVLREGQIAVTSVVKSCDDCLTAIQKGLPEAPDQAAMLLTLLPAVVRAWSTGLPAED